MAPLLMPQAILKDADAFTNKVPLVGGLTAWLSTQEAG